MRPRVAMICIDRFAGVPDFRGLGQLGPDDLRSLWPSRSEVTDLQLDLARRTWEAYGAPTPEPLLDLLELGVDALPFLEPALRRHLEQYPARRGGLSRTERQALESLAAGPLPLGDLFRLSQIDAEEVPFMGDAPFLSYVRDLACPAAALLRFSDRGESDGNHDTWGREVELTPAGEAVLGGRADRVTLGGIDRWLGGVHLRGRKIDWRWCGRSCTVVRG